MLKVFVFCLDSCIVKKGEKFVHALGTWERLEGVPIGSGKFWAVGCRAGLLGRSSRPPGGQMRHMRSNRPVQAV
jgi:hypothetical protein